MASERMLDTIPERASLEDGLLHSHKSHDEKHTDRHSNVAAYRSPPPERVPSVTSPLFPQWLLRQLVLILTPSFLQPQHSAAQAAVKVQSNARASNNTAYLDGLRGTAAVLVFNYHITRMQYEEALYSYGDTLAPTMSNSFLQLPYIRLIYCGSPMVSLFFIVSGYTLSVAPIRHMRNPDPIKSKVGILRSLSSAVIRRPIRLFFPAVISTIAPWIIQGVLDPNRTGTMWDSFKDFVENSWRIFEFMNDSHDPAFKPTNRFNWVLWTIPVEYRASLMLYLTHLGMAQLRDNARMGLTLFIWLVSVYANRWEMYLFWPAFLLADIDAAIKEYETKHTIKAETQRLLRFFYIALLVVGLYFASYPLETGETVPGYRTLTSLIPWTFTRHHRFWEGLGCLMFVFVVSRWPPVTRIFTSEWATYMGHISYALYLTHWPVLFTVGLRVFAVMFAITGKESELAKGIGFALSAVVIVPICLWVADIFWRLVDIPCVNFAKWVEVQLLK